MKMKAEFVENTTNRILFGFDFPIIPMIFSSIGTFGIIANTIVIGTTLIQKTMRNPSKLFLINLSLADLCASCFVFTFGILGLTIHVDVLREILLLCEIIGAACFTG